MRQQQPAPLFGAALLDQVSSLRAFAKSLCGNPDRADDLVQETLVRAWSAHESYADGTNMRAWLFTILRNAYFTDIRKRRREVEDPDNAIALQVPTPAAQESSLEYAELQAALALLPANQREAIILVGASGLSYEEASAITGAAIGTIKSRVSRGRERLAQLMSGEVEEAATAQAGNLTISANARG